MRFIYLYISSLIWILLFPPSLLAQIDSAKARLEAVEKAYREKDIDRCWELLEQALKEAPEYAPAYARRALLHYEFSQFEAAIQDYQKALRLDAQNPHYHYELGVVYYQLDELEKAKSFFSQAIQLKEDYTAALSARGVLWNELGKSKKALQDQNAAIAAQPDFAIAYYNRALLWFEKNKWEACAQDLDKALRLKEDYTDARLARAYLELQRENYAKVVQDCNYVIEQNAYQAEAFHYRGLAKQALGQKKAACEDWQKAQELGNLEVEALLTEFCQ